MAASEGARLHFQVLAAGEVCLALRFIQCVGNLGRLNRRLLYEASLRDDRNQSGHEPETVREVAL